MKIFERNGSVFIEGAENFDIAQIFTCGQCFRFNRVDDNRFEGVAFGRFLSVSHVDNIVVIHNCNMEEFDSIWSVFFDMDTDYAKISSEFCVDDVMKKAFCFGSGIRILKQELFECIISFIISQNNSIPNIQRVIERICEEYGSFIGEFSGMRRFAFPSPEQLYEATEADLAKLKCGYRASYIKEFVERVVTEKIDLNNISNMPSSKAREYLMSFKGIGGKVADCILLFCYHKFDVFPTDVWVKKAMLDLYGVENKDIDRFSAEYFGKYRGLAQQYLFYYKRTNSY